MEIARISEPTRDRPYVDPAEHFVLPAPPGELDLARWLYERTPMAAPTVRLLPAGAHRPLELPQVRASSTPGHRSRRARAGLAHAVHAAYLVDMNGLAPRELVGSPIRTERGVRQHLRDGRHALGALGAWPWAVVDGGPLPRNWWADRDFAAALAEWACAAAPVR
ncbi:MAG TPA: hypothetical protein VD790_11410 [Thermoleophilaceae bacterium]|nr:hypothetical protein [Thermoleophilaceae bacterium]